MGVILIAPDAFKECADAAVMAGLLAAACRQQWPTAEIIQAPVGDGGAGTAIALLVAGGQRVPVEATGRPRARRGFIGPLGEPVPGWFVQLPDGTAWVEMATASGLELVAADRRDAMRATTYGTGQLLRAVLARGPRRLVIGMGGSATVDGGLGALQALGLQTCDDAGRELPAMAGGRDLWRVARIDARQLVRPPDDVPVAVACDVTNPLLGERGAARVFGPQKGATADQVALLETGMRRWSEHLATLEQLASRHPRPGDDASPGSADASPADRPISVAASGPEQPPGGNPRRAARVGAGTNAGGRPAPPGHPPESVRSSAAALALANREGAGAAGGLAAALNAAWGAALQRGTDLVFELTGINRHLERCSLVITGEGRLDRTSLGGKTIGAIAAQARARKIPVVAVVGSVAPDLPADVWRAAGLTAVVPLVERPIGLREALAETRFSVGRAIERLGSLLTLGAHLGTGL